MATQHKTQDEPDVPGAREADVPLVEIFDYLHFHPNLTKSDRWWLYTKMHGRLATPWTCLVVVLIALPMLFNSKTFFGGL